MLSEKKNTATGILLITALGFFSLIAQTLLFREFITAFEGHEIGIAAFFATWLMWIALGAAVARLNSSLHRLVTRFFPLAVLLYLPAYILQSVIIQHVRDMAGVQAYELFPVARLLAMSVPANAPVCFLTGFLFTTACRWMAEKVRLPAAHVYIWETLGGALGGFLVTFLIWVEISPEQIFLLSAAILLVPVAIVQEKKKIALALVAIAILLIAVMDPIANQWMQINHRAEWAKLLPPENWRGAFTTAQARYLYGQREGQFIVTTGGGVCETLPPGDHAGEIVAIHLAEKPDARRVLIFGNDSLGICAKFKSLPQIERVTWMYPDSQYPAKISQLLKQTNLENWTCNDSPPVDIRRYADSAPVKYDLVILNLPDITTLVLNRYCTAEFFAQLKNIMEKNGVLSVRISGPANYMGREIASLGAATYNTLRHAFKDLVIKPGDETWLFATDGNDLQMFPPSLKTRFEKIPGAAAIYPPENLFALFTPDRADEQVKTYQKIIAGLGEENFINTDRSPKALFYTLLLTLKQSGYGSLASKSHLFAPVVFPILLAPIILYGLLRILYKLRECRRRQSIGTTDAAFLIFSTGLAGMAFNIVLLCLYQLRFGSLFLEIGFISALFMIGAFLGGVFGQLTLRPFPLSARIAFLIFHTAFLCAVIYLDFIPRYAFIPLFLACGFFTGVYFPLAAADYAAASARAASAGAKLEALDTLGGTAGAAITGLVLLPVLGQSSTLILLAALTAVNLFPALLWRRSPRPARDTLDQVVRSLAYLAAGLAIYAIIISQAVAAARQAERSPNWIDNARELAGSDNLVAKEISTEKGPFTYYEAPADDRNPDRYVFETSQWSRYIGAYGGAIQLAVCVDTSGKFIDYKVLKSNETPAYLYIVESRKNRLVGCNLFDPEPFKTSDIISGASITDAAIMRILETSGNDFAAQVLNRAPAVPQSERKLDLHELRNILILTALLLAAFFMRYIPRPWPRRIMLTLSLLVLGLGLNLQYSSHQVLSLVTVANRVSITAAFFLLIGIPISAVLFGNLYCGYLCPFGAAQELAHDLTQKKFAIQPSATAWRYTRGIKYLLLFLVVIAYATSGDSAITQADPLVTIFSRIGTKTVMTFAVAVIALSAVFPRFWCRNFCPAGAFISLLSGLWPNRRFLPSRIPTRCNLGVTDARDYDCIYCDQCRIPITPQQPAEKPARDAIFAAAIILVLAAFLVMNFSTLSFSSTSLPKTGTQQEEPAKGLAGKSRDLDPQKIKSLIQNHQLSDHPAEFQKEKQ